MRIIYIMIKYLLFPGAYIHAFWEQLVCRAHKIPVEKTSYVRFDEISGHPEHSFARGKKAAFMLIFLPGIINFFTGIWIYLWGYFNLRYLGITQYDYLPLFIISIAALYLGLSLLCSLFPTVEDALNCKYLFQAKKSNALAGIIAYIPSKVSLIGAYLEKYCIIQAALIIFTVITII